MLTCPNKAISITSFRENLEKAQKDCDLPRITPHSFRAGFTTQAINNGATVAELKEFGLWEAESSIQRYAKRADAKKAETGRLAWKKFS